MKRVLFIGNSYTYCNDLPVLIQRISEALGSPLKTDSITSGGKTLSWHLKNPDTVARVRDQDWDTVVLQEQSTLPVRSARSFHSSVKAWNKIIKPTKATCVLYQTWARQHKPEMQKELTSEYRAAAKATSSLLAPVGEAWKTALENEEDLILHVKDKSHPNMLGSYLAACVIAATITGKPASSLPSDPCIVSELASNMKSGLASRLHKAADDAIAQQATLL